VRKIKFIAVTAVQFVARGDSFLQHICFRFEEASSSFEMMGHQAGTRNVQAQETKKAGRKESDHCKEKYQHREPKLDNGNDYRRSSPDRRPGVTRLAYGHLQAAAAAPKAASTFLATKKQRNIPCFGTI
jgi:hypothetical protein